ncbi:hypothetical protein QEH38_gp57 [Mycobacterium phage LilSpotty]|uniref:Uncharacterized protein n=1 Tax=Mycobacterium phage LilSpotty TaxID=2588512 RepID=A0A4Y6EV37_9CAUD|nr:hypothetical protein QEH38_gp57 [Mycobacterium phage LilSpotty]QDF19789.1 hypothetical protein SEA_LILSPOTTY_57 [Mycobacterium phage LilSpotty]
MMRRYKGRHRANRFSRRVSDIQAELKAEQVRAVAVWAALRYGGDR